MIELVLDLKTARSNLIISYLYFKCTDCIQNFFARGYNKLLQISLLQISFRESKMKFNGETKLSHCRGRQECAMKS